MSTPDTERDEDLRFQMAVVEAANRYTAQTGRVIVGITIEPTRIGVPGEVITATHGIRLLETEPVHW